METNKQPVIEFEQIVLKGCGLDVHSDNVVATIGDENPVLHYGEKTCLNIEKLKEEYKNVSALSAKEAMKNSPLKEGAFLGDGTPQKYYRLHPYFPNIMDLQLLSS